ncbi:MAG: hypothetical protein RMJ83_09465 [Armatimonadota bacterium]|nr:hypothetical protein [Armatimonadota bacterium]
MSITARTVRQWLAKPVLGKTIAVLTTLSLFNLDLAPALEAKRVLEPLAPKTVELSNLPKPSLFAMLGQMADIIPTPHRERPPLPAAPGFAPKWGASANVYSGAVNLGNGNLTLTLSVVSWTKGVSFVLYFNSQANPSQASPIAPKWTHNWNVFLTLDNSQTQAVLQEGDGSRWTYTDPDGDGVFTSPTGVFDRLVRRSNGQYVLPARATKNSGCSAAVGQRAHCSRSSIGTARQLHLAISVVASAKWSIGMGGR